MSHPDVTPIKRTTHLYYEKLTINLANATSVHYLLPILEDTWHILITTSDIFAMPTCVHYDAINLKIPLWCRHVCI
eukprot:UN02990